VDASTLSRMGREATEGWWQVGERQPLDTQAPNETFPRSLAPSELLTRARLAMRFRTGKGQVQSTLRACAWWSPQDAGVGPAPAAELHSQLVCLRRLSESGLAAGKEADAILAQSRQVLESLKEQPEEAASGSLAAGNAEWARVAYSALGHRCNGIEAELRDLRNRTPGPESSTQTFTALRALQGLEQPFQQARLAQEHGVSAPAEHEAGGGRETAEERWAARGAARACLLSAVREARLLASSLPEDRALTCARGLLPKLETFATAEADGEPDAGAQFNLGLYWSEIAVADGGRAWQAGWVRDSEGWHVPGHVARAEGLLLAGEEASIGSERGERAAKRALRLYQHAKVLALKHHDAAAEWRFRAAARLAAAHRRLKLAAHSLARLSYFVMLRGRRRDALELAGAALAHAGDPFAGYLQATLRRALGELRTAEALQAAERQLAAAAGRLPSQALEEQRAAALTELRLWHAAGVGTFQQCLALWDAARVLICLLCKAAFM